MDRKQEQKAENTRARARLNTHTHTAVHKPAMTVTDQNNTAVQAKTTDEKAASNMGVELFNKDQLRVESRGYIRNWESDKGSLSVLLKAQCWKYTTATI